MLLLFAFVFRNQFYLMAFVVDDDVVFFNVSSEKIFPDNHILLQRII